MAPLTIHSTIKLQSGALMPRLGFGVYQSKDALNSVTVALETGYRWVHGTTTQCNQLLICLFSGGTGTSIACVHHSMPEQT